jgi:hypothetical protein
MFYTCPGLQHGPTGPGHILIEVLSQCGRMDPSKRCYVRSQRGRMRPNFLPCTIPAADNFLPSGPRSDQWCGRIIDFGLLRNCCELVIIANNIFFYH